MIPAVVSTWTGFENATALPALLILVGQAFWKEFGRRFAPGIAAWPARSGGVEPARDDASVRLDSGPLPQSIGHCCLIFAPYGDVSCGDVPL